MRVLGTQSPQCRLHGPVVSIIIVFVLDFFVFILFRFLFFRFSFHYFFVFVLVNDFFSFLTIFVLVFVNENHTGVPKANFWNFLRSYRGWMCFLLPTNTINSTEQYKEVLDTESNSTSWRLTTDKVVLYGGDWDRIVPPLPLVDQVTVEVVLPCKVQCHTKLFHVNLWHHHHHHQLPQAAPSAT